MFWFQQWWLCADSKGIIQIFLIFICLKDFIPSMALSFVQSSQIHLWWGFQYQLEVPKSFPDLTEQIKNSDFPSTIYWSSLTMFCSARFPFSWQLVIWFQKESFKFFWFFYLLKSLYPSHDFIFCSIITITSVVWV